MENVSERIKEIAFILNNNAVRKEQYVITVGYKTIGAKWDNNSYKTIIENNTVPTLFTKKEALRISKVIQCKDGNSNDIKPIIIHYKEYLTDKLESLKIINTINNNNQ